MHSDCINRIDRINSISLSKVVRNLRKTGTHSERVSLRGRRRKWRGWNQGREMREKGERLPLPFPSHAFFRPHPPPPLPLPFFLLLRDYCFQRSGRWGKESIWLPLPFRFRVFLLPSLFSPVTRLRKRVSMKTTVKSLRRTISGPAPTFESRGNVTPVKAQPIRNEYTSV